MHAHALPPAARSAAGLPPHAQRLPACPDVRLFPDGADAGWLMRLIAAHQAIPEVAGVGLQCWTLHVPARGSARLTCRGWRGGPDLVSLLLPAGCLPPGPHRGAGTHEFLVAAGALWTEPAWTGAGGDET